MRLLVSKRVARRLARRLTRCERGQELIEFTMTLPILMIVVFGLLEVGMLLDVGHAMAGLSREGANIAARGAALDSVVQITVTNGGTIGLAGRGGAIATRLRMQGGFPVVESQFASSGFMGLSRMGLPGDSVGTLVTSGLLDGQSYYVVELFLTYEPFTPLSRMVNSLVPDTLYDRSIF
jgi:hypothetical protein